ncbi:glyoxylate carboligase [Anaerocolumna sedimenticola]|uniref:Glyoxylate carboligase n=1 Tax=Anaerocolumna sedimenticola TaxID=2696063 RepID=A0A6P1TK40_9FIRM|nr:thiamine pyrophosphate-dependent enzyme [Anaerocolumna sedimenticola]QHQ59638.1 glyoxylate carboligase [Anaerocolumna sedimenticola]
MNLSQAIIEICLKEGITDAFGIPGAGCNAFYDALKDVESKIHHITMRHEECCVHAADGYYRSSGRMALAISTSGPGATNFVTGIYTANIDSIPLIAITGQAVRAQLGKDAFQCVDEADIVRPVAKHAVCITNPKTAVDEVIEAFRLAKNGKPGPVVLDIPLDMQKAEVDFNPDTYEPVKVINPKASPAAINAAMDMLLAAKNPVILMGGGVVLANAEKELIQFAEIMNIPVVITYMAKGAIPTSHPLYAGMPGIQCGNPVGNKTFLESDVVLAIGNRFTDRHTGSIDVYKGDRKFIHINVEASEIGKIFAPDLGITADAKDAIDQLLEFAKKLGQQKGSERVANIPSERESMKRKTDHDSVPINPHRVFGELNKAFDENTMFTTGCGITQIWSGQMQEINASRRYFPSGGAGCLGWDIPGAIGAMVGDTKKNKCVCVMGDFGFTFHVQELATAATNKVPLIVCIVNNAYLGLIRQNQKFAYNYEYAVAMPENQGEVDYVTVAKGFNCDAERVFKPEDIAKAFERAKSSDKPYVIDIVCNPQAHCSMGNDIAHVREFNAE